MAHDEAKQVHASQLEAWRTARLDVLIEWRNLQHGSVFEPPIIYMCPGLPKCDGTTFLTCRMCYPLRVNDPRSAAQALVDMRNWSNQ